MRFIRFQSRLVATILSFVFVTRAHAISSINPQPGQSSWTITSNIGVVLDEVTPYQPTALSDNFSGGSTVTISSPGIYRLSAPMTKQIVVSASDVELDLNGYGLSMSGSVTAIDVSGVSNVIVRNGYVIGSGGAVTGVLVDGSSVAVREVFIENIRVSGFGSEGICMLGGTTLEQCEVISCTSDSNGIGFNVSSCGSCLFSFCSSVNDGQGFSIVGTGTGNRFDNCMAGRGVIGFDSDTDTSVFSRCSSINNSAGGFNIRGSGNRFENCKALNTQLGFVLVDATATGNVIENCVAVSNTTGFAISLGARNMIQGCVATGNTTGFSGLGSNFAYQNRDIAGNSFAWVNNVAASP